MSRPIGTAGGAVDGHPYDGRGYDGLPGHHVLLGYLRLTLSDFPDRCCGAGLARTRLRGRNERKCEQYQGRHGENGARQQVAHDRPRVNGAFAS